MKNLKKDNSENNNNFAELVLPLTGLFIGLLLLALISFTNILK